MAAGGMTRAAILALAVGLLAACENPGEAASDAANFYLAIEASNEAVRLTNRFTTTGETPSQAERDEILRHTRVALEHAAMIRNRGLARMHDDMPRMFRERFEHGLRTVAQGLAERSPQLMGQGHEHLDRWADWLESNAHEIRFPPRPAATGGSR